MKPVFITLLTALCAAAFPATSYCKTAIGNGSVWNQGSLDYTAEINPDGSIEFTGCDEGQDLSFRFSPVSAKSDEYVLGDGVSDGAVNPFRDSSRAKHVRTDALNLLCLYDDQGRLCDVLTPLEYPCGEIQAQQKWTRQLMGEYSSMYGEPLTIGSNGKMRFSAIDLTYSHYTFNGMITGIIEIKGGTRLQGFWEAVITRDGLLLYKVEIDEYGMSQRSGQEEVFAWSRNDVPRFDFASKILLNDKEFCKLDNALMRLMRNEIWFHHGYMPSSADLQEYLVDKQWYTPRGSNDGIFDELSLIEKLNIELIKTAEVQKELVLKNRQELAQQVENVYNYIEKTRRYYLDTPPEKVEPGKWQPVDNLFATRDWRALRTQVDAIGCKSPGVGFYEFSGKGPLDVWMYDCFEGKITPQNVEVTLFDFQEANIDYQIKDATTIDPAPMCWRMKKEDGEWRVDNIMFLKDGYIDLREEMEEYVKNNGAAASAAISAADAAPADGYEQSGFDFDRYHQVFVDKAEGCLNYMKSLDDIRLIKYALIDIDNDDIPEIWAVGDEGQDFQGIYSIFRDNDITVINSSDARSELRFYPNAVGSSGYYGDGEFRETICTVKDSQPDQYCSKRVVVNNYSQDQEVLEESYCVNGNDVTEKEYADFCKGLGDTYVPQVKWYRVRPLPVRSLVNR